MKKTVKISLVLLLLLQTLNCGDRPLFTELASNRLKVVFKGTLESGAVAPWSFPGNNNIDDDSVYYLRQSSVDSTPTKLMIDIAEMRLYSPAKRKKYRFANYRQTMTVDLNIDNSGSDEPFFNGTGIVLRNDDVQESVNFSHVYIYFRKMLIDKAVKYDASGDSWVFADDWESLFKEKKIAAFDFNQLQPNSYYDTLREEVSEINRVFPLKVPIIGGLNLDLRDEETVLEIRIVFKNFIKKYELLNLNDDYDYSLCHFYALSDWLNDIRKNEIYIQKGYGLYGPMGGNVLAVARVYVPGKTGTITGNHISGNPAFYAVAIPADATTGQFAVEGTSDPLSLRSECLCQFPSAPLQNFSGIESYLDYYGEYEKYLIDWNTTMANCPDLDTYESQWTAYKEKTDGYKIPPLMVYVPEDASGFSINNVTPGSYNVYIIDIPEYGTLFTDDDFNDQNNKITATPVEVRAGTVVTLDN